jgi:hypothetical protein
VKRDDLARLYKLRQMRKDKALEQVALRHAALQRAEQQRMDATEAVADHIAQTLEHERKSFADMMGKVMSHADIANARTELTIMVQRLQDLMALEMAAGDRQNAAQAELKSATEIFHQHHRSAEKLRFLIIEQTRIAQRKSLAVTEAAEDELRGHRQGAGLGA